jgi:hypothetical protein
MTAVIDGTNGITSPGIVGVTDGSNALAGTVGEYVSSVISGGSPVSLSSPTAATLTSISLTAGDWDVFANFAFTGQSTTVISWFRVSTNTSATQSSSIIANSQVGFSTGGGAAGILTLTDYWLNPPRTRYSLSSTTTIYAIAQANFSAGTCSVYGSLTARRVR